jgi:hypothetical protein
VKNSLCFTIGVILVSAEILPARAGEITVGLITPILLLPGGYVLRQRNPGREY